MIVLSFTALTVSKVYSLEVSFLSALFVIQGIAGTLIVAYYQVKFIVFGNITANIISGLQFADKCSIQSVLKSVT